MPTEPHFLIVPLSLGGGIFFLTITLSNSQLNSEDSFTGLLESRDSVWNCNGGAVLILAYIVVEDI